MATTSWFLLASSAITALACAFVQLRWWRQRPLWKPRGLRRRPGPPHCSLQPWVLGHRQEQKRQAEAALKAEDSPFDVSCSSGPCHELLA